MSIKIYPTEVEAIGEDGSKMFTISLYEENVYNLQLHTMICKENLDELFADIRKGIELMEIEK